MRGSGVKEGGPRAGVSPWGCPGSTPPPPQVRSRRAEIIWRPQAPRAGETPGPQAPPSSLREGAQKPGGAGAATTTRKGRAPGPRASIRQRGAVRGRTLSKWRLLAPGGRTKERLAAGNGQGRMGDAATQAVGAIWTRSGRIGGVAVHEWDANTRMGDGRKEGQGQAGRSDHPWVAR